MLPTPPSEEAILTLIAILNSFAFDYVVRSRLGGTSLIWAVLSETALPKSLRKAMGTISTRAARLALCSTAFAPFWLSHRAAVDGKPWRACWEIASVRRASAIARFDALVATSFGLDPADLLHVLAQCDQAGEIPEGALPNGFWRVDRDKEPELRPTIFALVASVDLHELITAAGGDRENGIQAFLNQNDGEGWMLPETLRLADYGLGHDERGKHPQPVASRLGPRFYDWQLAQTAEESWRECEIHAKNLRPAGLLFSEAGGVADTVAVNKGRVPPRGKRRRQDEKGLFALDGQEDEPA